MKKRIIIKDKNRFRRSILLISIVVIGLLLFLTKKSYSKVETSYKDVIVCKGDTLWSIAREEGKDNKFFENKDIRSVVYEIKSLNNLNDSNLNCGQKIRIPIYE